MNWWIIESNILGSIPIRNSSGLLNTQFWWVKLCIHGLLYLRGSKGFCLSEISHFFFSEISRFFFIKKKLWKWFIFLELLAPPSTHEFMFLNLELIVMENKFDPLLNLYITKSWNVTFNAAALTLRHISYHVILFFFFFSFLKYNLSYNFKMVFTIFSPINTVHYLFIYFHYHPIINLYN